MLSRYVSPIVVIVCCLSPVRDRVLSRYVPVVEIVCFLDVSPIAVIVVVSLCPVVEIGCCLVISPVVEIVCCLVMSAQ